MMMREYFPEDREGRMAVTRREFVAGAALAAAGTLTGFPAIAQRGPLKVGVFISEVDAQGVDELVGPYVSQMRVGLGLAASEINAMGGILGRPVELVYRDDGGSPPSQAATTALIAEEGCEAIVSHDNGLTWDLDRVYILDEWAYYDGANWCSAKCGHKCSAVLNDGHILTAYTNWLAGSVIIRWRPEA